MTCKQRQEIANQERRADIEWAAVFARMCAEGDAERLALAAQALDELTIDGWRLAMRKVARLQSVSPEIQDAFLPIWIEHKMLPLRVGDRPTMAAALRILMPGGHAAPLTLYRGAGGHERRRRLYGFSWTTDLEVARRFARNWMHQPDDRLGGGWTSDGVLLKTAAPAEAILLIRQPEDYYDEGEVVADPFRLGKITLVERYGERAQQQQPPIAE